jgi:hypothetical protein
VDRQSLAQHQRTDTHPDRELRECRSCNGFGLALLDAEYDFETGELIQESIECFICKGAGEVSVYLYAMPTERRA